MSDLTTLLSSEIPEGLQSLVDSHENLERVAEYCESNYFQVEHKNKREALDETKRYTTQSLASVAYQVNSLAFHFLQLLDLQATQLDEMASQTAHIAQTIAVHKEKVSRREIGVMTSAKTPSRQYKILAPATPEKPVKYVRKPLDYTLLDEVGCGAIRSMKPVGGQPIKSCLKNNVPLQTATLPPSAKPTTPPMAHKMGTLRSNSSVYRAPIVAPPQVPSNYAPNYPIGHPRRGSQSSVGNNSGPGPGYTMSMLSHHNNAYMMGQGSSAATQAQLQNNDQRLYTTLPFQMSHHHQNQVTQNQVPLTSTGIPFRQRDIQPMSQQQMIYAENKGLGLPTGPASPPLPPPPEMAMPPPPPPVDNPLIPKVYLEKVIAMYDYVQEREDELSFQENSLIYVLKKNDDGWYEGMLNGRTGLFPGNYVEPCV